MTAQIAYDRKEQLQQIESVLTTGERIIAVYDAIGAGTGFLGLTDKRVIVRDTSFVGKKVAIASIPYGKVSAVSMVSDKSFAGSFFSSVAIALHVGTHTYAVEFRGDGKAHHVHNVILHFLTSPPSLRGGGRRGFLTVPTRLRPGGSRFAVRGDMITTG